MCPLRIAVREGIFFAPKHSSGMQYSLFGHVVQSRNFTTSLYAFKNHANFLICHISVSSVLRVDVFLYIFYTRRAVRLS